jgi:hypothetical protein
LKNRCRRRFVPRALELESRRLLSYFAGSWQGQNANLDLCGPDAGVGADGYVDDEIQLSSTTAGKTISYVRMWIDGNSGAPLWESSPNADANSNAEMINVTGGSGTTYYVYFNPFGLSGPKVTTGLGQKIDVTIYYPDNTSETDQVTVGTSNPNLTTTLSAPASITWNGFSASWNGQDSAQNGGKVHISLSGLGTHTIYGAVLSDQVESPNYASFWSYGSLASAGGGTLTVNQNGNTADIAFPPIHTEASATLTLRLDWGSSYPQQAVQLPGQACDPGLTVQDISGTSNTETPSSNLQQDANNYGTIYLRSGTYSLTQPLRLYHPVTICPASGATATLQFSQPQTNGAAPSVWDDAIEIRASHVTLQGFSVQFSGPILWTHTNTLTYGVINVPQYLSPQPIDVTISNVAIQGPTQSLFDQATDPTTTVAVSSLLLDPFTSNTIGTVWRVLSGSWSDGSGMLSQTSTGATSTQKKVIAISSTPFPGAEEIEANVRLDSINGDGRAGVGLNNDSNGNGYNLVFHLSNGSLAVQLLNDNVSWSGPVTGSWTTGQWYTFKLVVVPQGGGVDALYGKVWPQGNSEPVQWTISEIVSSGNKAPGAPSFASGSSGSNDYATADFQPIPAPEPAKNGSLVWTIAPYLFSAVDSTRWQEVPGSTGWSQSGGVLSQTDTSFNTNKRVLFPMAGTAPPSMMITADVTPVFNSGDGTTIVGVGLDTDSTGSGYELAFFKNGSTLEVELWNGSAQAVISTKDSLGNLLQTGQAYGMQLLVLHQMDGTDTVLGMVWPWGNTPAHYWPMWTAGVSHTLGSPSLDGGSGQNATAQFANIQVTVPTTPALPSLSMGPALMGQITHNTLTGGGVILGNGPWTVTNNTIQGTVPGTFSQQALDLLSGHDRAISGNTISQASPYGKTARLLEMGNGETWASNDTISGNTVVNGAGMARRSADLMWDPGSSSYGNNPNFGEFILTESYFMAFEGSFYSLSSDGRLLKIPYAQGVPPQPGDVVAVLNGSNAGQWFQVAQVIQAGSWSDPSYTLLMDSPLPVPSGSDYAISIDEGFVNETYGGTTPGQGNSVDIRGSTSNLFSLDGFQFGTRVLNNTFLGPQYYASSGAQDSSRVGTYSPFVNPNNTAQNSFPWGWTHTPVLGMQIDGNTFGDLTTTPIMGVDHVSGPTQTPLHFNVNRRYYVGQVENNAFEYSNPSSSPLYAVQVGESTKTGSPAADPYELSITAANNTQMVPTSFTSAGSTVQLQDVAGTLNGQTTWTNLLPSSATFATVNIAPHFSQVGLTTDNATSSGNLDGGGYSYSSNALGGSTVSWGGIPFALGPAGNQDVVQATGQTIQLPFGNYSALYVLGTRVQGGQTDTITLHYTDGSTSTVNQGFSDWANHTTNTGESVVEQTTYRNYSTNNGQQLLTMYLYGYSLPLSPGKTVQSVQLPSDSNVKILAMAMLYQPQLSLSGSYNQVGITSDEQTNLGNLDGGGYSYSMNALGGSAVYWGPVTFTLGPTGQNDVVYANGQTITLPAVYATSLKLLAAAVQGAQTGAFTVNYSDGTHANFTQSFSDWASNSSEPGESVVETMPYRNFAQSGGNGRQVLTMYAYGYGFALNPAKQLLSVTLPSINNIKILAMSVVSAPPQVSLGNSVDILGMTGSGESGGNLDGHGDSYAINLLGGTLTWNSNTFNFASDGGNNVVQATGQVIPLPPGRFGNLLVLATAANSVETGAFTIYYTDGTSTTVTQNFSTWSTNSSQPGQTMVSQMNYYYNGGWQTFQTRYLYGYSFALNTAKSVLSMALPNNGDIKILAMDMGSPQQGHPQVLQAEQPSLPAAVDGPLSLSAVDGSQLSPGAVVGMPDARKRRGPRLP